MKYLILAIIFSSNLTGTTSKQIYTDTDRIIDKHLTPINIYAPWRDEYVTETIDKNDPTIKKECPFCLMRDANEDAKYLVLYRGRYHMIILNFQPYTRGHLLIAPYEHQPELKDMPKKAHAEMMKLTIKAMEIIKKEYDYQGFNIGFNIGAIAGASVPDHLHMQVVPRKAFEASFFYTIANSKMTHYDLNAEYNQLLPKFQAMKKKINFSPSE